MAVLWTICGAGRKVGKTWLSQELCRVLPDSIYAKSGHGQKHPDKPQHFYSSDDDLSAFISENGGKYQHIVVESNSLALRKIGDVIIYIDPHQDMENPRTDRETLCNNALIRICADESNDNNWKSIISGCLKDGHTIELVYQKLIDQKLYLHLSSLRIKSKVWIEAKGKRVFGTGLADLLSSIDKLSSLKSSAASLEISYRKAWDMIKGAEKYLGSKLVETCPGGVGGGKSTLTPMGHKLLETYIKINEEVAQNSDGLFEKYFLRELTK